ncbi:hypothetical protein ATANTOWER_015469 [Ataeniobius toweri]|uniref:Uncharacterized protein n=1 Tax=Ataeniobius toweri TaxID=208326 RepID=A0ABU7C209_9TELE|nr:hypothetical protein [Ataeniobius toweri]
MEDSPSPPALSNYSSMPISIKSAFLPLANHPSRLCFKRSSSTEPSVLQLNFDVQSHHVRLQSDNLAAPRVVHNDLRPPSSLLSRRTIRLASRFGVHSPGPDHAACLLTPIWIYPTLLSSHAPAAA